MIFIKSDPTVSLEQLWLRGLLKGLVVTSLSQPQDLNQWSSGTES